MPDTKTERHDDVELISALHNALSRMEDVSIDISKPQASFDEMGLDSIAMLIVANSLEERLDIELPNHLMWDCPDFPSLAEHLRAIVPNERLAEFIDSEAQSLADSK
jgi:acyl carrier protein